MRKLLLLTLVFLGVFATPAHAAPQVANLHATGEAQIWQSRTTNRLSTITVTIDGAVLRPRYIAPCDAGYTGFDTVLDVVPPFCPEAPTYGGFHVYYYSFGIPSTVHVVVRRGR